MALLELLELLERPGELEEVLVQLPCLLLIC